MNLNQKIETFDLQQMVSQSLEGLVQNDQGDQQLPINSSPADRPQVVEARSGQPTLRIPTPSGPVHLHSTYDPVAEARTWVDEISKEEWQLGMVLGLGMGYHIEELVQRFPDRILIIFEPDPAVLQEAQQNRNLKRLLRGANITLCVGGNAESAAHELFQNLRRQLYGRQSAILAWPPSRRIWSELWDQVQRKMWENSNQDFVNLNTYRGLSQMWLDNILRNLPTSIGDPGVSSLFDRFRGKPAVLVAAGPSLDRNGHLLKQIEGKALIVAVLQAVRSLEKMGIRPDIVVSFDPKEINYSLHFDGVDTSDTLLLYADMLYPQIVEEHRGPRMAMGLDIHPLPRWIHNRLGQDKGVLRSGPSVANLTWDLIARMGADPVIFVGQDLAFTGDRSHASDVSGGGALSDELKEKVRSNPENYSFVEDIHGERILTNRPMLGMKTWYEQHIAGLGERRFIDATEGGAYIEGTEVMTLQEAIDRHCVDSFAPGELLEQIHTEERALLSAQSLDAKLLEVVDQLQEELDEVVRLGTLATGALRTLQRAIDNDSLSEARFERLYKRIRHLDRSLSRLEGAHHLISVAIHHQIEAINIVADSFLRETDLPRKAVLFSEIYLPLFQASSEAAIHLSQSVEELRRRIEGERIAA